MTLLADTEFTADAVGQWGAIAGGVVTAVGMVFHQWAIPELKAMSARRQSRYEEERKRREAEFERQQVERAARFEVEQDVIRTNNKVMRDVADSVKTIADTMRRIPDEFGEMKAMLAINTTCLQGLQVSLRASYEAMKKRSAQADADIGEELGVMKQGMTIAGDDSALAPPITPEMVARPVPPSREPASGRYGKGAP